MVDLERRRRRRIAPRLLQAAAALVLLPTAAGRLFHDNSQQQLQGEEPAARLRGNRPTSTSQVHTKAVTVARENVVRQVKACATRFSPQASYQANDVASTKGANWRCKRYPYDRFCGMTGYAPGTGHGALAWERLEECEEGPVGRGQGQDQSVQNQVGTTQYQNNNGYYTLHNDRWNQDQNSGIDWNHGQGNANTYANGYANGHHTNDVYWATNNQPANTQPGAYHVLNGQNNGAQYTQNAVGTGCAPQWTSQQANVHGAYGAAGAGGNGYNANHGAQYGPPSPRGASWSASGPGVAGSWTTSSNAVNGAQGYGAGYGAGVGAGAGHAGYGHNGVGYGAGAGHNGAVYGAGAANAGYVSGSVVSVNANEYACKKGAAAHWCNLDYYAPGAAGGSLAWNFVGVCRTQTETYTVEQEHVVVYKPAEQEEYTAVERPVSKPANGRLCPDAWELNHSYAAGQRVTSTTTTTLSVYECKEFPYTAHCGDHRAEVGVGPMFPTMWRYVGTCIDGEVVEEGRFAGRPVSRHPTPRPTPRPSRSPVRRPSPPTRRPTPGNVQEARPAIGQTRPSPARCAALPRYESDEPYAAGDVVSHRGSRYECSLERYCFSDRFEPGVTSHWMLVWDLVGPC